MSYSLGQNTLTARAMTPPFFVVTLVGEDTWQRAPFLPLRTRAEILMAILDVLPPKAALTLIASPLVPTIGAATPAF